MKTIEQKALAYDEAIRKAKKLYEKGTITESIGYIFPELAESEDERIRKEIVRFIQMEVEDEIVGDKWIAWLKKQESVEEIVERCKKSWYNEGKIQGQIEGLTDEEKYQQGWHDALEKQGEKPQGKTKEKTDNANKVASAWNNGYSNGYIHAIEKACDWLKNHNDYIDVKDGNITYFDMEKCVVNLKRYLKGGEND